MRMFGWVVFLATLHFVVGASFAEEHRAGVRVPAVLSADGQWILRPDAGGFLERQSLTEQGRIERLRLSGNIAALSASRTGKNVAVLLTNGCVGVATFPSATAAKNLPPPGFPLVRWLFRMNPTGGGDDCPSAKEGAKRPSGQSPNRLAISADGRYLAMSGSPSVSVTDLSRRFSSVSVPVGNGDVLHLQFFDTDKKLLVVQSPRPETGDARSNDRELQFAVWDLVGKQLFNFYRTKALADSAVADIVWSFSANSGRLQWLEADKSASTVPAGGEEEKRQPQLRSVLLASCSPETTETRGSALSDRGPTVAWDPLGSWVAGVTAADAAGPRRSVVIRDVASGAVVAHETVDADIGALVAGPDGTSLYALGRSTQRVRKVDLSSALDRSRDPLQESSPNERCRVEDEISPDVRRVEFVPAQEHEIFQSLLDPDLKDHWQMLDDGTLWIDRSYEVHQLNPENGRVLRRVATPRSSSISSLPVYSRQQFLSWQGDTISLRPFSDPTSARHRETLVSRPGWSVHDVVLLGERFGVRWIEQRCAGPTGCRRGNALAAVYDMSGRELHLVSGFTQEGTLRFVARDEGTDATDVFSAYERSEPVISGYSWERSFMDSVRVRRIDRGETKGTVLWIGLQIDDWADPNDSLGDGPHTFKLIPGCRNIRQIRGAIGAQLCSDGVGIYDAEERRQIAFIGGRNIVKVAVSPSKRVVLVQTQAPGSEIPELFFYEVSQSQ